MRSLAPRALLAGVLAITVTDKVWRLEAVPMDMHSAVLSLAVRNGWTAHETASPPDSPLGKPIAFRAAACEGEGQIFLVHLSLQAAPMLDHAIPSDYTRRFVYLGRTWMTQDRWGMRAEWLKQRLLGLLGLGDYAVNETALVIAEPKGCGVADKVDWGPVWKQGPAVGSPRQRDT